MTEAPIPKRRNSKLAPLPPLKIPGNPNENVPHGRRRLSSSWTENLDETPEIRSPGIQTPIVHSPIEKQTSTGRLLPQQKSNERKLSPDSQNYLNPKSEKRQQRRESIKDHLLKFKMKAGKVLEEVHDRLVEDHSVAVGPSPVMSPNATSELPSIDNEESSFSEDRVKSPTLSQASKKTSNSAEIKAALRSKIRKQAEKVVERTRGSVQLTRRLQRQMTSHQEEGPTEKELQTVDEQIEDSLRLGARFMSNQPSIYPSDEQQLLFFTRHIEKELELKIKLQRVIEIKLQYVLMEPAAPEGASVLYRKAVPAPEEDSSNTIIYEAKTGDLEEGMGSFTKMAARLPPSFLELGTPKNVVNLIFKKTLKWPSSDAESYSFVPAKSWEKFQNDLDKTKYLHMTVLLDTIWIEKHRFASNEDVVAASLRRMYYEQLLRIESGFEMIKEVNEARKEVVSSDLLNSLFEKVRAVQSEIHRGATAIQREWAKLEEIRSTQGYTTTTLKYTKTQGTEDESPLPFLGFLTEDDPISPISSLSADVKKGVQLRNRTQFRIALYYNDMLVGYSTSVPLVKMRLHFADLFHMEVHSAPINMYAVILEKVGRRESPIARIDIPLSAEKESGPLTEIRFTQTNETENMPDSDKTAGSLSCQVKWLTQQKKEENTSEKEIEVHSPKQESFSLIPAAVRLCSDEEFESNIRWEVLEKRFNRKLAKSAELRRIGMDSSEIDPSLLFSEERSFGSTGYRSGIDGHRRTAASYAAVIRTKLLARYSESESALTYDQLVKEELLPSGFGAFGSLFGPPDVSRKLKPMRKEIARQQVTVPTDCRIVVNVQSASNLPTRKNGTLQPVVEVSFQGQRETTTVVGGRHPNWQQSLHLPVSHDQSGDLKGVVDQLKINIYDQMVSPLEADDREPNTVHEQLIRQLIGTLRIPFSTIYCRGKIDGGLRIQTPIFITGYHTSEPPPYIKLLIAMDPPIIPPRAARPPSRESAESEKMLSQCLSWTKSCSNSFEDRRFVALVTDVNGKRVLPCRYLRPIRPPPVIEQLIVPMTSAETIGQVSSYIPFLADPLLFPGTIDLWTTMEQFVSIGCGDEEEHAVLVCCWLLGLHIQCYLVLDVSVALSTILEGVVVNVIVSTSLLDDGSALPEGDKAAYVLVKLPEGMRLINPCDGNMYQLKDAQCPLLSIGTVVAQTNIYANVQSQTHPSQMNFDFTKSSDWKPVFDKEQHDLDSVQPSGINYQTVNEDAVVELRSSIEREIKLRFDEARQYAIPQWNLMASRLLREILQDSSGVTGDMVEEKLSRLRDSYSVTATAIRIPYESLKNCAEVVLSLNLHVNTDRNAQFALAVHIQPYFNNIVSCSIALAVLTLKK